MNRALMISCFLIIAQLAIGQTTRDFASLDAVAYVRGTDSVQVEAYYSIVQKSLKFSTVNEKTWNATISGTMILFQDGKEVAREVINKTKIFSGSKNDLISHSGDVVLDAAFFHVAAKSDTKVMFVISGVDAQNKPYSDSVSRQVNIPKRKTDKPIFGGLELASSLQKVADNASMFEKLGYVILPNPSNLYGGNYQKLYYYTEIALPQGPISTTKAEVITRILDVNNHEMYRSSQLVSLDAELLPVIGSVPIDGLPSDTYIIEVSFIHGGVPEANIQRGFFYDSGIQLSEEEEIIPDSKAGVDEQTLFLISDFNSLGEFELNERAEQTKYIMTEPQKSDFKKLQQIDDKRHFLFYLWRAKDGETPNAQPLSAYRAFVRRIELANKQFTIMKTPGWKTSRGRVLIQYGIPDEIQRQSFSIDTKPYFIWEYVGHGIILQSGSRAQFVFVDKQGGGNFVLVHSNVRGETSEPDWYSREALQTTN